MVARAARTTALVTAAISDAAAGGYPLPEFAFVRPPEVVAESGIAIAAGMQNAIPMPSPTGRQRITGRDDGKRELHLPHEGAIGWTVLPRHAAPLAALPGRPRRWHSAQQP